jgi:hypothetical protein
VSVVVVRVPGPDLDLLGAYPPADTVTVVSVALADCDADGGGTLRVRWQDGRVAELTVALDS